MDGSIFPQFCFSVYKRIHIHHKPNIWPVKNSQKLNMGEALRWILNVPSVWKWPCAHIISPPPFIWQLDSRKKSCNFQKRRTSFLARNRQHLDTGMNHLTDFSESLRNQQLLKQTNTGWDLQLLQTPSRDISGSFWSLGWFQMYPYLVRPFFLACPIM